jgi:hypothetical protein
VNNDLDEPPYYDRAEARIFWGAMSLFGVAALIGVAVLLSGHGIAMPSAPRVSPAGVTTTMGDASRTP